MKNINNESNATAVALWQTDHAYYCNEGNYYASGREQPTSAYRSWAEFLDAEGDCDFDYNLLFRWDWKEGENHDLPPFNGDVNYRNGKLVLFWMGQRKGLYRWTEVEVCRADEPAVRKWLWPRFDHLVSLWDPFVGTTTPPVGDR